MMLPTMYHYPPPNDWGFGYWNHDGTPDLSSWQIMGSYDSAAECMTAKENLSLAVPDTIAKKDRKVYAQMASLATKKAVCISTDDPRLKDK
jgi:hypothetical protein